MKAELLGRGEHNKQWQGERKYCHNCFYFMIKGCWLYNHKFPNQHSNCCKDYQE
jgi:hypothetical protein